MGRRGAVIGPRPTRAERLVAYEKLKKAGMTNLEIAKRWGCDPKTVANLKGMSK